MDHFIELIHLWPNGFYLAYGENFLLNISKEIYITTQRQKHEWRKKNTSASSQVTKHEMAEIINYYLNAVRFCTCRQKGPTIWYDVQKGAQTNCSGCGKSLLKQTRQSNNIYIYICGLWNATMIQNTLFSPHIWSVMINEWNFKLLHRWVDVHVIYWSILNGKNANDCCPTLFSSGRHLRKGLRNAYEFKECFICWRQSNLALWHAVQQPSSTMYNTERKKLTVVGPRGIHIS